MQQFSLFDNPLWTVSKLTRYLRELIEDDSALQNIWIEGEVSNISRPASGHLYFTLKDNTSALQCVMWRSTVAKMPVLLKDGEAIEAHGSLNIYEAAGKYQLYIDDVRPIGQGRLFQEFLRLKAKLEAEGLFDVSRKRTIPTRPNLIGVITSPSGAAIRDIINTLSRRYPLVNVIIAPTQVQGIEAPAEIIAAVKRLNHDFSPDVIILARGGGSLEDLWAFNDEKVARAVAGSNAPVISGVGHETDFTIVDFVSDLRAPTPTAAAELATPDQIDLRSELQEIFVRIQRTALTNITSQHANFRQLENRLAHNSPRAFVRTGRQRLDELSYRSATTLTHWFQLNRLVCSSMEQRLLNLDPRAVIKRGYAIVSFPDGKVVRRTQDIKLEDKLRVLVSNGLFGVKVTDLGNAEED